ncbi:polysaccharide biosynthesis protein [Clostridium sp. SHJSY1]|uniref:putative polysaccharide biosynthesis protein n=1 Tax=Clostridium sp. SHJSY1 TaxID=2942483 RepID=UPI002875E062|nr:polysaccharide biosynthesis protein [Clostridium sp. SHJSY1]MDS0525303.1 polysaccharide biosynthesis protein [Clostridium sp. SHJSY1]
MKKQSLIKGSLILGITGIVARFLGLFFRWPLIMLIGDEGIGYYQMSYPLYMFFVAMASGIPVAMSKMISENNAKGNIENSFQVVKESTILMMIIGTGTSFILFLFAKPIINFLQWDSRAYYSLIGISIAPFIVSLMTVFRGFFQGFQNMTAPAISQIFEQVGRVIFGVGIAILLLPKGIEYSAGGAAFGAAAGAFLGSIYLFVKYCKVKKSYGIKKVKSNPEILNKILRMAIPISLGATVSTIMSLIDSILVPQKLLEAGFSNQQSTILYAQLTGKASVIVNIPLTLSMALCTSLIPIIAENYILKRRREVENKIDMSLKLSAVIGVPCMFGLFFMAEPVMKFVFPGRFDGVEILKYFSLSIPFIIVTQTTTSILQSVGSYVLPVINLFLGCIIKVILTIILVPMSGINIYGAVIASIGAYIFTTMLNVVSMKIKLGVKFKFYENFIKPAYAASFMMIGVLIIYNMTYRSVRSNSIACLLSISVGVIIYAISILILKVFDFNEIRSRYIRQKN